MQITLTQSDLATLTAALDLHRAYIQNIILTTTGPTKVAAEVELAAQDELRGRLNIKWRPSTERDQYCWCGAPRSVWDNCYRGCWSGCTHCNYVPTGII